MKLFKREDDSATTVVAEPGPTTPGAKGRATPRRKDAQARNLHPVVPADRKAAKREARAKQDEAWERQRRAMATGEEKYLPARDKGPIKRYIRDYVDARYSLGELFLPLSLLLIVLFLFVSRSQQAAGLLAMLLLYAFFILAIVDALVCWLLVRRRLYAKFGREEVRSHGMILWYVFGRCFNLRRLRQPAPQVARRQYPE